MYTELQCQHETFTLPCSCDDIAISVVIYVEYPPLNCYFLYNFRKKHKTIRTEEEHLIRSTSKVNHYIYNG